jgi:hypothetical protein
MSKCSLDERINTPIAFNTIHRSLVSHKVWDQWIEGSSCPDIEHEERRMQNDDYSDEGISYQLQTNTVASSNHCQNSERHELLFSPFIVRETKAQRDEVIFPRSHSLEMMQLDQAFWFQSPRVLTTALHRGERNSSEPRRKEGGKTPGRVLGGAWRRLQRIRLLGA